MLLLYNRVCHLGNDDWATFYGKYTIPNGNFETKINCNRIPTILIKQVFLPWETIIPNDPVRGPTIIGLLVFFSYAIVANTVVPISLYVSVEVNAHFSIVIELKR